MMRPKVSVIVVAFNCKNVIYKCIKSCVFHKGSEIILIDNASTDNTLKQIEEYGQKLVIIKNDTNKGFTYACNQGINVAKGKYILLLNPDAILEKDSLNILANYLDINLNVGAVAPVLKYPNCSIQNYTRTFPSVLGLWVESFVPLRWWNKFRSYREYTCQKLDFSIEQQVEQPAGAALMFRKQWLLDEHYFIYVSDVDLCKTIVHDGYKIMQIPQATVIHYQSKGGTDNYELRPYLDLDNYYGIRYYLKKNNQYKQLVAYLVLFSVSLFVNYLLALFGFSKNSSNKLIKLGGFLKNKNFNYKYE